MRSVAKGILVGLLVLVTGCGGTGTPKSPGAPAPLTSEQRYKKYEELQNRTAGIPYVSTWHYDSVRDKYVIGLATAEAKAAVEREMAALGLPPESVVFEHPEPLLSEKAPFAGCVAAKPSAGDVGGLDVPPVMAPGQNFELMVALSIPPDTVTRGVDSYLECWTGTEWSPRYMLLVGFGSPDAKPSARVGASGVVPGLGLMGMGPEKLVLPEPMPKGWYRIRKSVVVGTAPQTLTATFEVR